MNLDSWTHGLQWRTTASLYVALCVNGHQPSEEQYGNGVAARYMTARINRSMSRISCGCEDPPCGDQLSYMIHRIVPVATQPQAFVWHCCASGKVHVKVKPRYAPGLFDTFNYGLLYRDNWTCQADVFSVLSLATHPRAGTRISCLACRWISRCRASSIVELFPR